MNENLKALLLYVLAVSILYAPVVFLSKTLQPPLYQPNGILKGWPYGYRGRIPVNTFSVDLGTPAFYEWPTNRLVGTMYRKGELPLWNPYQGAGAPLAAQYSTRVFFPYQILEDLSPLWLWDFFILGRPLAAGFFTFLYLRLLGVTFASAFLGGLLYMFSGTFTWFINLEQFADNAMMVPVLLYSLEGLVRRNNRVFLALSALSFGLVLLAGQPETALYVLFLGACYYTFRILYGYRGKELFRYLARFILVTVLGLALAAPLVIPFIEFMNNSFNIHRPGGDMGVRDPLPADKAFAIFTPTVHELPQNPDYHYHPAFGKERLASGENFYFRMYPTNGEWDYLGGYTGSVTLLLALTGLVLSIRSGRSCYTPYLFFFTSFALVVVLKNFGVKPFLWLGHLPLFDQAWSQRWAGPVWTFSFAAAGALGFEVIRGLPVRPKGAGPSSALSFAVIFSIYASFAYMTMNHYRTDPLGLSASLVALMDKKPYLVPSLFLGTALTALFMISALANILFYLRFRRGIYGLIVLAALELWWAVPRGYDHQWLLLKVVPLSAGIFTVLATVMERRRPAAIGLILFLTAFIWLDLKAPRGFPDRYDPFTPAPYVNFLKRNAGYNRVTAGYGLLFPDYAGALGIQDIRHISALSVNTFHEYRKHLHTEHLSEGSSATLWFTGRPELLVNRGQRTDLLVWVDTETDILKNLLYYSFLGVKYIVLPSSHNINKMVQILSNFESVEYPYFRVVFSDTRNGIEVYENPVALPRAFSVHKVEYAPSYAFAQKAMAAPGFDIRNRVFIEKRPPRGLRVDGRGYGNDRVSITSYSPNRVEIDASLERPGLVVLTDVFYPGWRVYVDGVEEEIYRVNGLVRGVFVKEGSHRVVFVYRPATFVSGAVLFGLSFIVCTALVAADLRNKGRADDTALRS